jgi:Na+/H+ antiporter
MRIFELMLILLVGAVLLAALARRIGAPYPALLALGGTALALLPHAPNFRLDPGLTLALFVAPVLLDTAFDTSLRDLRANWIPVICLALIAVGVTTLVVALVARALVPDLSWPAAVALGAIVAPPDAAAASAVLRQIRLPHRLLVILEGESLLNDASALLIYRVAIVAAAAGELSFGHVAPTFALAVLGSLVGGYLLAKLYHILMKGLQDAPSAIIMQFAGTFGVWILAERANLSPIITVVVYALTLARQAPKETAARLRVPSYAVWETVVFVLNVMAFMLIGLQLRPILGALQPTERRFYFEVALAVLLTVIVVRFAWVMTYYATGKLKTHWFGAGSWPGPKPQTAKGGLTVAWCGMRGVVTLAAAYALPAASADSPGFQHRDLILLCAFCVVVGTLVIQGLTLRPLINWFRLEDDEPVGREVALAQEKIVRAALEVLDGDSSTEAEALRQEFCTVLEDAEDKEGVPNSYSSHDDLRARIVKEQRRVLFAMRTDGEIGDDAFHAIEENLDWKELSSKGRGV